MATIIEYTDHKRPIDNYPKQIVSPISPRPCCNARMEQIGVEQHEAGWSFVYKRCKKCGFAVRHVTARDSQLLTRKGSRFDCRELIGFRN